MRGPIHQTAHILYEVGYFLISLVSRVYNAINGGSMHQTYSPRDRIEAKARWASATTIKRDAPIIEALAAFKNLTPKQVDALFGINV